MCKNFEINVPEGTVINGIDTEGKKVITSEFIELLPEGAQGNIERVRELAAQSLGHSKHYLKEFWPQGTAKIEEEISEAASDIILKYN